MFVQLYLVGWGLKSPTQIEGFGESPQGSSTKTQILHLIRSIRTVMKCKRQLYFRSYLSSAQLLLFTNYDLWSGNFIRVISVFNCHIHCKLLIVDYLFSSSSANIPKYFGDNIQTGCWITLQLDFLIKVYIYKA